MSNHPKEPRIPPQRGGSIKKPSTPPMAKGATISDCGTYRYHLWRVWDSSSPSSRLGWVMLNPSTADASIDDRTVSKCCTFAKREGFGGIEIVNLFAFRSVDPKDLKTAEDPIGPDNNSHIVSLVASSAKVVCAWGNHGSLLSRADHTISLLKGMGLGSRLYCLKKTKTGSPSHPLYLPNNTPLLSYP